MGKVVEFGPIFDRFKSSQRPDNIERIDYMRELIDVVTDFAKKQNAINNDMLNITQKLRRMVYTLAVIVFMLGTALGIMWIAR